jgi:ParB family transcriptional regulator, chromosome partitioning protein
MFETRLLPRKQLLAPSEPLRVAMDSELLRLLEESLRQVGQLQPLVVKPYGDGAASAAAAKSVAELDRYIKAGNQFEIIDGHRRFLAAPGAGLELLRCTIIDTADVSAHAAMLHANIMREDVTPAEEGWQFLELATKHQWSLQQLMETFQVSENYINDRCELVQKDPGVAAAAQSRAINMAQAKQILRAKDKTLRTYMLDQAITHGANARTLEVMRHNWTAEQDAAQGSLLAHTPPASVAPDPAAVPVCIWCGQGHDPENFREVKVHWYHQAELQAVVDQLGAKNLLAGTPAKAEGA